MSSTFLNNCAEQAEAAIKRGQQPVILHGGDLDPSGIVIPRSIKNKLERLYDLDVTIDRFALTSALVAYFNLPVDPHAFKPKYPNAKRFMAEYGTTCVELDALDADVLKEFIHEVLGEYLDIPAMQSEQEVEKAELEVLKAVRRDVMGVVRAHGYKV